LLNEAQVPGRVVEVSLERESAELRLAKPLRPAPLTGRPHSWDY
jgi:hypothetical protein